MSPAAAAYVARGGRVAANPGSIPGLVARYRASDQSALTDGTSLTTWADLSGQGNTLSVLSNAPTKQTVSGRTCVRFASASSQSMSKNTPSGVPATGPFTILAAVMFNTVVAGTHQVLVENAGASNAGWAAGHNGGYIVSNYSNEAGAGIGPVASDLELHVIQLASNGTTVTGRRNNRSQATTGTTGGLFAGSPTRLTVGRADFFPTWALNADVYELCIFNRILSDQEIDSLRPYFDDTYGIKITGNRYNAAAHLTTSPTADGSSTAAEIGVLYDVAAPYNGHKYLMTLVPLGSGNAANENPHIFFSDDGTTWSSTGVTNPVVAARGSGNNADPHLFDNRARDSKVYLYWSVQGDVTTANNGVWAKSSSDGGVTWSAAVQVDANVNGTLNQEATVRWDGSQYVLYMHNASTFAITRKTSASPTSGYGTGTTVNVTIPGSRNVWHQDLQYVGGRWFWAFSDTDTARNLWLAISTDGVNFTCSKRPVLVNSIGWDAGVIYRPAILPPDDTTTNWRLWYTAGNVGTGNIWVGYTEFPAPEWPN